MSNSSYVISQICGIGFVVTLDCIRTLFDLIEWIRKNWVLFPLSGSRSSAANSLFQSKIELYVIIYNPRWAEWIRRQNMQFWYKYNQNHIVLNGWKSSYRVLHIPKEQTCYTRPSLDKDVLRGGSNHWFPCPCRLFFIYKVLQHIFDAQCRINPLYVYQYCHIFISAWAGLLSIIIKQFIWRKSPWA